MRRLIPVLVGLVIVVGGGFALLALFNSRDSGEVGTGGSAPQGPGVLETEPGDPPTSGDPAGAELTAEGAVSDDALVAGLAAGNVALVYGTPKPPPELERLRDDTSGAFDPKLAATGLSVFLVRRPDVDGIQALAWERRLEVQDPSDPALTEFVDAWLGRGRDTAG